MPAPAAIIYCKRSVSARGYLLLSAWAITIRQYHWPYLLVSTFHCICRPARCQMYSRRCDKTSIVEQVSTMYKPFIIRVPVPHISPLALCANPSYLISTLLSLLISTILSLLCLSSVVVACIFLTGRELVAQGAPVTRIFSVTYLHVVIAIKAMRNRRRDAYNGSIIVWTTRTIRDPRGWSNLTGPLIF